MADNEFFLEMAVEEYFAMFGYQLSEIREVDLDEYQEMLRLENTHETSQKVDYQAYMASLISAAELPEPTLEYRFHPTRKWRVDLAWPELKLALEIEGGVYTRGRHTRPTGFTNDIEKYNELTLMGFQLLRVTPEQIKDGSAMAWLERALGAGDEQ